MSIFGQLLKVLQEKNLPYSIHRKILEPIANLQTQGQKDIACKKVTEILMADIPEEESVRRILHEIAKL